LEGVHENLRSTDHLMKGIESASYYLFGGAIKTEVLEKPEKKKKTKFPEEDSLPFVEIELLLKKTDIKKGRSFSPCTLVFNAEHFQILNSSKDKLFLNTKFSYLDVHTITMKTNEFFNISFNNTKKTLKFCSAYSQIMLNQLYAHSQQDGQHEIIVDFNESAGFEYKDEWIYKIAPDQRKSKKIENQEYQNLSSLFAQEETIQVEEINKTLEVEEITDREIIRRS